MIYQSNYRAVKGFKLLSHVLSIADKLRVAIYIEDMSNYLKLTCDL